MVRVQPVRKRPVEKSMVRRKIGAHDKERDTIPKPAGLGEDSRHERAGRPPFVQALSSFCPRFVQPRLRQSRVRFAVWSAHWKTTFRTF